MFNFSQIPQNPNLFLIENSMNSSLNLNTTPIMVGTALGPMVSAQQHKTQMGMGKGQNQINNRSNRAMGEGEDNIIINGRASISDKQVFTGICRALLTDDPSPSSSSSTPSKFSSPSLPAPLGMDHRQDQLVINWDQWHVDGISARGGDDYDAPWRLSQFEAILRTVSRIRTRIKQLATFLRHIGGGQAQSSSSFADKDFASKYLLYPGELLAPVCATLTTFCTELNTFLMEKIVSERPFSNLFEFCAFIRSLEGRISRLPGFFDQLSSSMMDGRHGPRHPPAAICTFWHCFLQNLSGAFQWPEATVPAWKNQLFEGIVNLLGTYLTRCISNQANSYSQSKYSGLEFFEVLWADDPELEELFNFSAQCECSAPLRKLEETGKLTHFHSTLMTYWQELKEQGSIIPAQLGDGDQQPPNRNKHRQQNNNIANNPFEFGPVKMLNKCNNNGPLSSSTAQDDQQQLHLLRFSGATYYKPAHFPTDRKKGGVGKPAVSNGAGVAKFCCSVCSKAIPKTKMDFILLRLPAHTHCAKTTMMVLSDSEEEENELDGPKAYEGDNEYIGSAPKRARRASTK